MATYTPLAQSSAQRPVHPSSMAKVVGAQSIPQEHHASVKHLAAAFRGFSLALESQDSQDLVFWGRTLLSDQANSGVVLIPGEAVEATIKRHAERLKQRGLN